MKSAIQIKCIIIIIILYYYLNCSPLYEWRIWQPFSKRHRKKYVVWEMLKNLLFDAYISERLLRER